MRKAAPRAKGRTADTAPRAAPAAAATDASEGNARPFGRERFVAVWNRRLGSSAVHAGDAYDQVDRLLGAPARHFHNLDHIHDCIDRVDEVAALVAQPDLV